ncbi:bifunctional riboflavin kinase/FAD synthetase [Lutibacter sp. B1]|uniref:bifunctional riboflavin kinase/FAD synthetase n=1 Tax=Lutibacter sp. B1 TaxID=2725996 RepID=UPI001456B8EA|nr:bifunctional riboflavin kinase/FAD synthetase [Lutibacter sp. B1]NLP57774.1 bifunctional riboflavin kinase/FAD synthetase [Lutibacter sp. B1]
MKIYTNLSNYKSNNGTFITIGTFDGVHIGHQKVIQNLIQSANKNSATSVLLTFFPHPRMVLQKDVEIKLINTIDERIKLLKKTGVETLVIHEFNEEFAKQSALDFVRNILVNKLNVSRLIIGYDHHFGKNREGNFEQLEDYGHTYDFTVEEISKQDINNIAVSSTKIRKAVENGEIEKANSYLGYYFMLTGNVVKGKNLGEKIGFPTANLFIKEAYKLIPKTGAYIVKSEIDNKTIFGMMNIGYRPTVSGNHQTIEIHFFDFNKNLYGKEIQIDVLHFLREEQKFKSINDLKNQLSKDKLKSIEFINGISFE